MALNLLLSCLSPDRLRPIRLSDDWLLPIRLCSGCLLALTNDGSSDVWYTPVLTLPPRRQSSEATPSRFCPSLESRRSRNLPESSGVGLVSTRSTSSLARLGREGDLDLRERTGAGAAGGGFERGGGALFWLDLKLPPLSLSLLWSPFLSPSLPEG